MRRCSRIRATVCFLSLAFLITVGAGAAFGPASGSASDTSSPLVVFADYAEDLRIDGTHPPADLRAALEAASGDPSYEAFASAVSEALDRDYLGTSPSSAPSARPAQASELLGETPPLEDGTGPPMALRLMTIFAGALVIAGVIASLGLRRLRGLKPPR